MTTPTPPPERQYRILPAPGPSGSDDDALMVVDRTEQFGRRFPFGRHVHHDPRSRRFAYRPRRATLRAVAHLRRIPVFDQSQPVDLGSCTGMAGIGVLGTEPYYSAYTAWRGDWRGTIPPYELTPSGAVKLYGDATRADPFPGTYPPEDTGSDGLSVAKVLTAAGVVPGYQHTFSLADALAALQEFPLMVGTVWLEGMFAPNRHGIVPLSGAEVGGHEYVADEFVPAGATGMNGLRATVDMVGFTNSWGEGFGLGGRFYMTAKNFGTLLAQDGDVIALTPPTAVPPVPTDADGPESEADQELLSAFKSWMGAKGL